MTVIAQTVEGKKVSVYSATGPSTYASPTYATIPDLNLVGAVLSIDISGGYKATVVATTGNKVAYKVFYQTGASGTPLTEVATGTSLSSQTVSLVVVGS
jgi:hypothetical protein